MMKLMTHIAIMFLGLESCIRNARGEDVQCDSQHWFAQAIKGDTKALSFCLETLASKEGSDAWMQQIEARDEVGCTAVVLASMNDNLEMIRYLASKGADLDAKCFSGTTALMHAAKRGFTDIVKFLHDNGVDVQHSLTSNGWTATTFAARHGRMDTLKYLHKIDLEFVAGDWEGHAMMWAAAVGDENRIDEFIAQGVDVNAKDKHGFTSAFWAAQKGQLKALEKLRQLGASLEARSAGGMTMLMAAAYFGHADVCVYLLDHSDLDVDDQDFSHWTAIMWAALGGSIEVVKQLESAGACMKPKGGKWDPLMVAATSGNRDIVEWFLARGLSFTAMNHEGKSASDLAKAQGHHGIAGTLDRMWEINEWHAKKTRDGLKDAIAREGAIHREAQALASEEMNGGKATKELLMKHINILTERDAEKEAIVRLREQQAKHAAKHGNRQKREDL